MQTVNRIGAIIDRHPRWNNVNDTRSVPAGIFLTWAVAYRIQEKLVSKVLAKIRRKTRARALQEDNGE